MKELLRQHAHISIASAALALCAVAVHLLLLSQRANANKLTTNYYPSNHIASPQQNHNGRGSRGEQQQQRRHASHYNSMSIVPSSHFQYNEGRKYGFGNAAPLADEPLVAEASGGALLPVVVTPNGAYLPPSQHIYKRSSALISGPHFPQLLSGAQLSLSRRPLSQRSRPMASRRMMAPNNAWASANEVLARTDEDASVHLSPLADSLLDSAVAASVDESKKQLEAELLRQKQHIQYHDQWLASASSGVRSSVASGKCHKRTLNFCASVLPFNSTVFPNIIGDTSRFDVKRSLPFFGFLAKSSCNRRLDELLCLLLEPPCNSALGEPIPPCKKFCRLALEGCSEYIPATLALSSVFDCRQYPDSADPSVCINLAAGAKCAPDEFRCPDKTCIPNHWLCDGVRDCEFAADEANCTANASSSQNLSVCSTEEFKCDGKCVPKAWKCDGERDCLDGTDEEQCDLRPKCGSDRFRCADGNGCLPKRWVCDGKAECRDSSDELNCLQRECSDSDFKCDNGICVPKIWRCDTQFDCRDGSDERDCLAFHAHLNASIAASHPPTAPEQHPQPSLATPSPPLPPATATATTTTTTTTTPTFTTTTSTAAASPDTHRANEPTRASPESMLDGISVLLTRDVPVSAQLVVQHQNHNYHQQQQQQELQQTLQQRTQQSQSFFARRRPAKSASSEAAAAAVSGNRLEPNGLFALRKRLICNTPSAWKSRLCAGLSTNTNSLPLAAANQPQQRASSAAQALASFASSSPSALPSQHSQAPIP